MSMMIEEEEKVNKYSVVWGGRFIDSKENIMWDGYATIEGKTFEEAREEFFQRELKKGFRLGFIELFEGIEFFDLKKSNGDVFVR